MTKLNAALLGIVAILSLSAPAILMQSPVAQAAKEYGDPIPGLSRAEEDLHVRGRRLFRWELWRPDRAANGFNENECSKCHLEPMFGGSNNDSKTYAAFVPDSNSISGWSPFHRLKRNDGRRFVAQSRPENSELRRAPSLYGLGLFEAVPDSTIKQISDPNDTNGDEISGRFLTVSGGLARFGWRGDIRTIESFTIAAFKNEMGMNVEAYDREDFSGLSILQIRAVAFYIRTLSPPPAQAPGGSSKAGRAVFDKIQCGSCHTAKMETGASTTAAISKKTFFAYTDLLLHEMSAKPLHRSGNDPVSATEYRTPALWGLGGFGGPFWHDGTAKTIQDAILKHDGEAARSRISYENLNRKDQDNLVAFLKSL